MEHDLERGTVAMKTFARILCLCILAAPLAAQQKRVLAFEDSSAVRAVSDPAISPDLNSKAAM